MQWREGGRGWRGLDMMLPKLLAPVLQY